jgi:hypothetical protein
MKKVVKFEFKLGLPFMVCNFVYKFQINSLSGIEVTEQKPFVKCTENLT